MADVRGAPRYSTGAIVLHWAIAAAILFQISLGWRMEDAGSGERFGLFQLHKSVGLTILLLTLARIAWRLTHRPPPSAAHGWEHALARAVHSLFYVMLLALPLSGWLIVSTSEIRVPTMLWGVIPWPDLPVARSEGLHDIGEGAHGLLVWGTLALLALHLAGVAKHLLVDHDTTLHRMAPGAARLLDWRVALILVGFVGALAAGKAVPAPTAMFAARTEAAPVAAPVETAPVEEAMAAAPAANVAAPAEEPLANETQPAEEEAPAEASRWAVQPGSTLGFAVRWNERTLRGRFAKWDADILFGPEALDQSRVTVRIETASAATGDGEADGALPGADWFGTGAHPAATFTASEFRSRGGNAYEARGTLTLKGASRPARLRFTLDIDGDTARMRGSTQVDRRDFAIGWKDDSEIAADVTVSVDLTARRQ